MSSLGCIDTLLQAVAHLQNNQQPQFIKIKKQLAEKDCWISMLLWLIANYCMLFQSATFPTTTTSINIGYIFSPHATKWYYKIQYLK